MSPQIIHSICQGYLGLDIFSPESAWATAGELSQKIAVSRSTVYRYMPELVRLGFFESRSYHTVNKCMTSYRMTKEGEYFMDAWKELPNVFTE